MAVVLSIGVYRRRLRREARILAESSANNKSASKSAATLPASLKAVEVTWTVAGQTRTDRRTAVAAPKESSMSLLAKHAVMEQFLAEGVKHVFGNPGSTELAFRGTPGDDAADKLVRVVDLLVELGQAAGVTTTDDTPDGETT